MNKIVKNIIEKYPTFFKTEISAVNSLISENNQPSEPKQTEQVLQENEIQSLKKEIIRLKNENAKLRKINQKKHIKEQTKISNLTKQVETLTIHFNECVEANKLFEKKTKALSALCESQRTALNKKSYLKSKNVKESLNKKIKSINNKKSYEENVNYISQKTSLNESIVKKYYKSLDDNINETIDFIKKSSPYLNETKKPVKVLCVNESAVVKQQQINDEYSSTINTETFLKDLFC